MEVLEKNPKTVQINISCSLAVASDFEHFVILLHKLTHC